MANWDEFSQKKIIEVRQRIQTVVVYEELEDEFEGAPHDPHSVRREAIVDSFDRPIQAQYQ